MKEKLLKKGFKRRLFGVVLALAMVITLLPVNSMLVYAETTKYVLISGSDLGNAAGNSITKEGVTITADSFTSNGVTGGGTFTTSSGKFTKIYISFAGKNTTWSGTGWSYPDKYQHGIEWVGDASSVSFEGGDNDIMSITCTIVESHSHDWEYSLVGTNAIKAHCKTDGHTGDDVTLTLTATSPNYSAIENLEAFNTATGKTIVESNVEIYKVDAADTTTGGTMVTGTPSEDGYYYASLTVEGQTAVKAFTIGNLGGDSGSGSSAPKSEEKEEEKPAEPTVSAEEQRALEEEKLPLAIVEKDKSYVEKEDAGIVPNKAYNLSAYSTTRGFVSALNKIADENKKAKSISIYTGSAFTFDKSIVEAINKGGKDVVYYFKHAGHIYSVKVSAKADAAKILEENGYAGPLYVGKMLGTSKLVK